jgi:hypothetical protein
MLKPLLALTLLVLLSARAVADGTLIAWGPRDLSGMTEERFNAAKKRTVAELVKLNQDLTTWPEAYELLLGVAQLKNNEQLRAELVKQIVLSEKPELTLTSRLIIWERIASGEILFEGKGLQVNDDLFTAAGRANWCLRTMTDRNFGVVRPNSTAADLEQLQASWQKFLAGDELEDTPARFPSEQSGLSEICSPEAIHALITSLRPGERKSEYVKTNLKQLYNLDALPDDPESPAQLCNPDTYANHFLESITQVSGVQSWEWWETWWETNQEKLIWDPEVAKFKTE